MNTDTGKIHLNEAEAIAAGARPGHVMPITPTPAQAAARKVGRNDLCPCGSGLKFKQCHLGKPFNP